MRLGGQSSRLSLCLFIDDLELPKNSLSYIYSDIFNIYKISQHCQDGVWDNYVVPTNWKPCFRWAHALNHNEEPVIYQSRAKTVMSEFTTVFHIIWAKNLLVISMEKHMLQNSRTNMCFYISW